LEEVEDDASEEKEKEKEKDNEKEKEEEEEEEASLEEVVEECPASTETVFDRSPKRKHLRENATTNQRKQAKTMYQRAKKVDGGDYKVGDVVQIPLADVDTTKVDSKCITAVVVEVTEHDSYRVACKQGVMKSLYPYHRLLRVSGVSNDRGVHGLEEIYESWRGTTALSEREAALLLLLCCCIVVIVALLYCCVVILLRCCC